MKDLIQVQPIRQQPLDADELTGKQPIELRQTTELAQDKDQHQRQQRHLSSFKTPERRSLDSTSSTQSSSSAQLAPPRPQRAVQVATRYVSPPQVEPHWTSGPPAPAGHDGCPKLASEHQLVAMMSLAESACKRPLSRKGSLSSESAGNQQQQQQVVAGRGKPPFMFAGLLASVLGSVFFSISLLCIKLMPDSAGFQEQAKLLLYRGTFMSLPCAITILVNGHSFLVPRDEIWINLLRALFGTISIFGTYCSLKFISLGDSTALVFSSPIWTSIMSHFILKEPLQWLQIFALPASILGIVLIAHPSLVVGPELIGVINLHRSTANASEHFIHHHPNGTLELLPELLPTLDDDSEQGFDFEARWPGILIALISSLFVSAAYIVLKFRKSTPIQVTTFWLGVCMLSTALLVISFMGYGDVPYSYYEWSLLLGTGTCSWLGQSLLQWAFFYESAGVLSVVRTLDVALSFVLSAIFLADDIYWTSVLGSLIIIAVVVSIMLNGLLCPSRRPPSPELKPPGPALKA